MEVCSGVWRCVVVCGGGVVVCVYVCEFVCARQRYFRLNYRERMKASVGMHLCKCSRADVVIQKGPI